MKRGSKTYGMLVDVARQLFAELGYHNTTMNDIANASKKGRRTLYTYFKNKEEIYLAVVEHELSQLIQKLDEVSKKEISAEQKLIDYIYIRLDAIRELVHRNGTLRADFFNDVNEVAKVRRKLDIKDIRIIKNILNEGVQQGIFNVRDLDLAALLIHYALRGIEIPYLKDTVRRKINANKMELVNFLVKGFKKNPNILG